MAWDTEMVLMLRHMIDDVDSPQTYSDSRLQTTILIAGYQVNFDVGGFNTTYTFDFDAITLSPDPTTSNPRDNDFVVLTLLKAACMIVRAEIRDAARNAIDIKDGRTTWKTKDRAEYLQKLIDSDQGPCAQYEEALLTYKLSGNTAGVGILGPFSGESTQWYTEYYNNHRSPPEFH